MGTWLRSRIASRLALLRLAHSPRDVLFLLRVFWFAASVPWLVRRPLPEVERLVEPRYTGRPHDEVECVDRVVTPVLAVLQAGRPIIHCGCLTRGLTLYHFLRRAGLDVHLCFGMGSVQGSADVFGDGYDGHCWLVRDGAPLLEPRDPRPLYTPIWAIPSLAVTAQTEPVRTNLEMRSR
jgi:hypothetical protein